MNAHSLFSLFLIYSIVFIVYIKAKLCLSIKLTNISNQSSSCALDYIVYNLTHPCIKLELSILDLVLSLALVIAVLSVSLVSLSLSSLFHLFLEIFIQLCLSSFSSLFLLVVLLCLHLNQKVQFFISLRIGFVWLFLTFFTHN